MPHELSLVWQSVFDKRREGRLPASWRCRRVDTSGCAVIDVRSVPPSAAGRIVLTTRRNPLHSIGLANKDPKADVLQGTLDLMVLQTVGVLGPLHGYAIASRLEQLSRGALQLNMGTLYPALMRLEQRGCLRAKWGMTDSSRRARFYSLTPAGRRALAAEKAGWDRMTSIMHALLRQHPR